MQLALSSCKCWPDLIPSLETGTIEHLVIVRGVGGSTFRISHILCICASLQWHLQNPPPPTGVGLSSQWCVFPHRRVNTPRPNTVKLISFHHRGSFWLSDKSILSLIINCDTRNQRKAAVLNKWHVFCAIILCILTNMTH